MYYEIENSIPLPPRRKGADDAGRKIGRDYPFGRMEIGQSFFCPDRTTQQLSSAACNFARKYPRIGFKFAVRQVPGGTRVWRIR